MVDLPPPPLPIDVDLRDFPYTRIYRHRLFGSTFHARATDAEWRAGFTLWLKSWDQVPPGSLPTDDVELCRLAELGRDVKTWRKVKAMALHGWQLHSDQRLYHSVVTEGIETAIEGKRARHDRTAKARAARLLQRLLENKNGSVTDQNPPCGRGGNRLSQNERPSVTWSVTGLSHGLSSIAGKGEGKGKGEGEGYKESKKDSSASANADTSATHAQPNGLPGVEKTNGSHRGTRLPDDWQPSEHDRKYAEALGLDPDNVAIEFRNYWLAETGKHAIKLKWPLVWANRCIELSKRNGTWHISDSRVSERPTPTGPPPKIPQRKIPE